MIYLLNAPFILDFLATTGLFVACFIVVIGFKTATASLKELFPTRQNIIRKDNEFPSEKVATKKPKRHTARKPVRSIEIDPDKVDRIYVKKIS